MKPKRLAGPVALTTTLTTNLYNETDSKLYSMVRHIHIVNKTVNDQHFTIFLGATGANVAGTELYKNQVVRANDVYDAYLSLRLDSTDFLVGGADLNTALTMTIEGDLEVV